MVAAVSCFFAFTLTPRLARQAYYIHVYFTSATFLADSA
ncbi:hypothetical protein AD03_1674 [Escherichia coli 2-474-04_S4_C2]|jgi:hypothetical protein|uniref:Uncharacterized protein n=10 Tax=Enterobacteriaceae TaxID=543 RepID=A0A222C3E6_ECOLX|nr:hypothetical protein ECH74115_5392 [Escherichia coli O157:H7 str. EC4115]AEE59265.1 conserved hypothetical protein [Escherichia coli UMNK88]AEJ59337.1 hypothetical protein UMNF18_4878 [Escherichia coli UMNF18]AHG11686.1 hypothetical protein ECRM13514_5051 [Escherichia coli O145:H28 str. RM13514]AHG17386.1 hypothetical protein ECRM13516_4787 [Escherichia coli O145:H28 str. RM13516]AHY67709.1 hypothetical protein ECRM12761_23360 [Escherichia coli O145:H28 str. RM12761]AHY73509.1 hypothetical